MKNVELERIFLLKHLPHNLTKHKSIIIRAGAFYKPNTINALRIRQKGNVYELIKKEGRSSKIRTEHIIFISKQEYAILWKEAQFTYEKKRYKYPIGSSTSLAEIDIYSGILRGYARVEVEFQSKENQKSFCPPDWFGPEITQWNCKIHDNLWECSFDDMKKRYAKKNIQLKFIVP